jgi:xanthine dehydrogenase accessory factor
MMSMLGFYVIVYDDRAGLNTLSANRFAQETHVVQYESIGNVIQANPFDYVAIMTIGYRSDKIVLRQLVEKSFFYLGMLGSAQKVSVVLEELRNEGIPEELLSHIHAPIGLNIGSQTACEIAISIAAEIIKRKNASHPGR